ncbi:HNH endonuclease [Shewanella phage FishSpeaker]|nr:HNH endonuclease [Shewanella phage FishSpeaker]
MSLFTLHYLKLPESNITYELKNDFLFYDGETTLPHLTFTDSPDKVLVKNPSPKKEGDAYLTLDRGLLILFACRRFYLPLSLWRMVDIQFLDDNTKNYDPRNLYVMYKEKIPYPELEGFYYIPGHELNVINEKGVVFNIPCSKLRPPKINNAHIDKNTYIGTTVEIKPHKFVTRVLHRLLGLVFKNPPKGYPNCVVDHLNAVKYDFSLDNLEWVSSGENNDRAKQMGLRTDNKRVEVLDTKTGITSTYISGNSAAAAIGCSNGILSNAFTSGSRVVKKRWKVRYVGEEVNWDSISIKPSGNSEVKPILARNVVSGHIRKFPSVREAMRVLSKEGVRVHLASITRQVNNSAEKRITGGYEFKYQDDSTPWHVFTEWDVEVFRRGLNTRTPVYNVTDVTTKESTIYFGWQPVALLTGVEKRAVLIAAAEGGILARKFKIVKLR